MPATKQFFIGEVSATEEVASDGSMESDTESNSADEEKHQQQAKAIVDLVNAQEQAAGLLKKLGLESCDLTESDQGLQLLQVLTSINKSGRKHEIEEALSQEASKSCSSTS